MQPAALERPVAWLRQDQEGVDAVRAALRAYAAAGADSKPAVLQTLGAALDARIQDCIMVETTEELRPFEAFVAAGDRFPGEPVRTLWRVWRDAIKKGKRVRFFAPAGVYVAPDLLAGNDRYIAEALAQATRFWDAPVALLAARAEVAVRRPHASGLLYRLAEAAAAYDGAEDRGITATVRQMVELTPLQRHRSVATAYGSALANAPAHMLGVGLGPAAAAAAAELQRQLQRDFDACGRTGMRSLGPLRRRLVDADRAGAALEDARARVGLA